MEFITTSACAVMPLFRQFLFWVVLPELLDDRLQLFSLVPESSIVRTYRQRLGVHAVLHQRNKTGELLAREMRVLVAVRIDGDT